MTQHYRTNTGWPVKKNGKMSSKITPRPLLRVFLRGHPVVNLIFLRICHPKIRTNTNMPTSIRNESPTLEYQLLSNYLRGRQN